MHLPSFFANLHYVTPELARCMQPFTRGQWDAILHHHTFGGVINLRGENPTAGWYKDEVSACADTGCAHFDLLFSSKRLPRKETLLRLLALFTEIEKPILIKCSGGADRTGLASGLFLLDQGGLSALSQALGHLRLLPYLHYAKPQQRWIRHFFHYFSATHGGRSLRTWIEEIYTEEGFTTYLEERGMGDYWRRT